MAPSEALARADGLSDDRQLEVLFVCGRNAARSQMAAALAQSLSRGRINVHSAGTRPADQVDPAVIVDDRVASDAAEPAGYVADLLVAGGCRGEAQQAFLHEILDGLGVTDAAPDERAELRTYRSCRDDRSAAAAAAT